MINEYEEKTIWSKGKEPNLTNLASCKPQQ